MSHPHPELGPPPPLAEGGLRVVPLGGLGEVGRNMTVLECDGALLVIDCGVLFPEDHQPGVDLVLPDFAPIRDRLDDVVALVLTHGHEDHIGAVPYLLRERGDIPLIGSRLTLALVEAKLREHRLEAYQLTVQAGDRESLGPFDVEFLSVNHSIPDALAVAVRTPAGLLLHTGDFKADQLPLVRDSRGLARALSGDYTGAVDDFEAFVAATKSDDFYREIAEKRQRWIEALGAGLNPFDAETLNALRAEN